LHELADYMLAEKFQAAIERLITTFALARRTALMSAEALPWRILFQML
jgi:hypothetical protein